MSWPSANVCPGWLLDTWKVSEMDKGDGKRVGAVLVQGSGIAGIQASLDLANSGFRVYLIERAAAIGGMMSHLDKTFPTGDCATCIV